MILSCCMIIFGNKKSCHEAAFVTYKTKNFEEKTHLSDMYILGTLISMIFKSFDDNGQKQTQRSWRLQEGGPRWR